MLGTENVRGGREVLDKLGDEVQDQNQDECSGKGKEAGAKLMEEGGGAALG